MPRSVAQITKEIEALQKQADALLAFERPGALSAAKEAVALYGLTAAELGFADRPGHEPSSSGKPTASPIQLRTSNTAGAKAPVKYRDSAGNQWTGRGMKPRWLSAAIAAGRTLESFAVAGSSISNTPATPRASVASKAKPEARPRGKGGKPGPKSGKALTGVKFKDTEGRTWSGRGPKPQWLSSALASGKSMDDFRV
jgi:DNA-binding protein H-NS